MISLNILNSSFLCAKAVYDKKAAFSQFEPSLTRNDIFRKSDWTKNLEVFQAKPTSLFKE